MENNNKKSRVAAGMLGILLGSYGVHNFYLGYTNKAITQVVLSVGGIILATFLYILASFLSVFIIGIFLFPIAFIFNMLPVATWVWGLIEGIMLLSGKITKDGNGEDLID